MNLIGFHGSMMALGGGAPGKTYTGYSVVNRGADSTLQNNDFDLFAVTGGVNRWALSNASKAAGKFHVQLQHVSQSDTMGSGIAFSTSIGTYMGGTTASVGLFCNYGSDCRLYNNGGFTPYSVTFSNGDNEDLWIDIDAGLVWWGKNGTPISGSPLAGTGAMHTFTPGTTWLISDTTGGGGRIRILIPSAMSGGTIAGFEDGWPD